MNNNYYKKILENLYVDAMQSCHPSNLMQKYIPKKKPSGITYVVGAGKASSEMAKYFEKAWEDRGYGKLQGLIITRYGHASKCKNIQVVEASHPVPDSMGFKATKEIIKIAESLKKGDLLIFLVSGGASSLLVYPRDDLTLKEKQKLNLSLLRCGATISEINTVRKHLSAVKGGQLALHAYPAKIITLAISDVPGDEYDVIGSGPTYPDKTSRYDTINILNKYHIKYNNKIRSILNNDNCETPDYENKVFRNTEYKLIARPQDALNKAAKMIRKNGFKTIILSDSIEGNANDVGIVHGAIALQVKKYNQPFKPPLCILSGGETTVTVNNNKGKGGRNTQFLLSLAIYLNSASNIYAIACDTDGIDGSEDNAGAIIYPDTIQRSKDLAFNPNTFLNENNSYTFFKKLNDLIVVGPTNTNVNDFRAILVV